MNLVCESKQGQLISIQWIKHDFLVASILDAKATLNEDDGKDKDAATSEDEESNDKKSTDESTAESTKEPAKKPEELDGKTAQEQPAECSKPSAQQILIWKSEGMAEALREQDFVMPRGFH